LPKHLSTLKERECPSVGSKCQPEQMAPDALSRRNSVCHRRMKLTS